MMAKRDDGGQAFPIQGEPTEMFVDDGKCIGRYRSEEMSLLDYFAGCALEGIDSGNTEAIARLCYDRAEAMIAEKRKREQK